MKLLFSPLVVLSLLSSPLLVAAQDQHVFQNGSFSFQILPNIRLPKPLSDFTATLHPTTGLVYIAGGCDAELGNVYNEEFKEFVCNSSSNKLYSFDKETGTFATLADLPVQRYRHGAALVNNQLWLLGGRDTAEDALLTTVDVYNIDDDTWKSYTLDDETQWRSDNAGFADPNAGLAYFVGGYDATYNFVSSTVAIDTVATTDTGMVTLVDKPDMIIARGDLSAVTSTDQTHAIATGGFGGENGFCEPLLDVERYDFQASEWTEIGKMNAGRGDKALVAFKSHFFAMGGERQIIGICDIDPEDEPSVGEKTIAVDDFEVYHPETDSWEVLVDDLPYHNFRFAAVGFDDIDAIYAFGGQKQYSEDCQCYRTTDEVLAFAEHENDGSGGFTQNNGSAGESSAAFFSTTVVGTVATVMGAILV